MGRTSLCKHWRAAQGSLPFRRTCTKKAKCSACMLPRAAFGVQGGALSCVCRVGGEALRTRVVSSVHLSALSLRPGAVDVLYSRLFLAIAAFGLLRCRLCST